jgi:hypothetical protein
MSRRWHRAPPLALLSVGVLPLSRCGSTVQVSAFRSGAAGVGQGFIAQVPGSTAASSATAGTNGSLLKGGGPAIAELTGGRGLAATEVHIGTTVQENADAAAASSGTGVTVGDPRARAQAVVKEALRG